MLIRKRFVNDPFRPINDRERFKAKKVKLHETNGFDVVFIQLRDYLATAFFAVQGGEIS